MALGWKVLYVSDWEAIIKEENGGIIRITVDGVNGYSFVMDYLNLLQKNYRRHICAVDMLLQKMLGEQYKYIRSSERIYRTRLVLQSLSCGFGGEGDDLDCDEIGEIKFRFVHCPIRSLCPMNGFRLKKQSVFSCCNPIYETSLSPRQLELLKLLVHTSYAYKDVAEMMGIAEGRVKNIASEIFSIIGVCDRQELTVFFRDKRFC